MKQIVFEDMYCWSVFNDQRQIDFNGHLWVRREGNVLIDPVPMSENDLRQLDRLGGAALIVLTNADHERERQATVCPDMARCRALVERIAPFDVALYRLANELFEAHLKDEPGGGASSSTRRRLRASEQKCPPRAIPARRFEQLGRGAECPCVRFTDPGV